MDAPSGEKFSKAPLLIGIVLALLILALAALSTVKLPSFQSAQTSPSQVRKVSPSPAKSAAHFLTLDQPEDNLVTQNSTLMVTGKTSVSSTVIVLAGEETQLADVGQNGTFSFSLKLQEGQTTIEVTSFDQNGEEKTISREVFYTTETI